MIDDAIAKLEPELASLVRRLETRYRQRRHPLERAHYLLLMGLEAGALSAGEIAQRFGLDPSTVARQADAVIEKGFARRLPNPKDRRSVLIELTAQGAAAVAEMRQTRRRRLKRVLAEWNGADVADFTRLVERFNLALMRADEADPPTHERSSGR